MKANTPVERLYNGVVKENPTFVLLLGMCPTLAVTTSAINGLGMGLTTAAVLAMSNLFISLLRKIIPDRVRIPAFIVIIASFVTVVELLLEAYIPSLYDSLGLYIPLIVVNCIILGRAEAYASKNGFVASFFDGLGMGLGFTIALTIIGAVRELIGAGEMFGMRIMPESYIPCAIFIMAPGAFFVLAVLTAIQNVIKKKGAQKGKDVSKIQSGCGHDCLNCADSACNMRTQDSAKAQDSEKVQDSEKIQDSKKEQNAVEEQKKLIKEAEFIELDDVVADTVEITADDIAAINAAVSEKEPVTEEKSSEETASEEPVSEEGKEDKDNA